MKVYRSETLNETNIGPNVLMQREKKLFMQDVMEYFCNDNLQIYL